MYGKTVDAVLLKGVGYKLFLVHHVFGEGTLHAYGVCSAYILCSQVHQAKASSSLGLIKLRKSTFI